MRARPIVALAFMLGIVGGSFALCGTAVAAAASAAGTTIVHTQSQTGEAIGGTLRGPDDNPVSGVRITVLADGKRVGQATTRRDGSWTVQVPGPGTYDVRLQTATLPDDLEPAERGGQLLRNVRVHPGLQQFVLFNLVPEGQGGQRPTDGGGATPGAEPSEDGGIDVGDFLSDLAQLGVGGIQYGAIIAITSIGLSLVFGTTGLINFAHGELVTLGAVAAFFLNASPLGPTIPLIAAAVVTIGFGVLLGAANDRFLWRPLRHRRVAPIQLLIISIGLALFLRHIVLWLYGSRPRPYADYAFQEAISLGPVQITPRDLVIVLLSFAVLLGVGFMLLRTRTGKAIRAVADNPALAEASGIDVDRVILVVWMLGGGLAALGGVLFGLAEVVSWDMGFRLLLLMFAAVLLGGLGTAFGAVVGSLVVGLVAKWSTLWFESELESAWALLVLILVLLVRPQGIFGRRERVG